MQRISSPNATGPVISSDPRPLIVVFGAAVMQGGEPTPTLARRIGYARTAAQAMPEALVFCSGRTPESTGLSEAFVIKRELSADIDPARLILDEASRDTLQTVLRATRLWRKEGLGTVYVCTDRYHIPRCRMLFRLAGVPTRAVPTPPEREDVPREQRRWNHFREAAAIPYDFVAMLFTRDR